MSALILDILIEQGADFQREFSVTKAGVDLPNFNQYTVIGYIKTNTGVKIVDFTVVVNSSNTILASLNETQIELLKASKPNGSFTHRYYIKATSPTGLDYRIAEGRVTISAD